MITYFARGCCTAAVLLGLQAVVACGPKTQPPSAASAPPSVACVAAAPWAAQLLANVDSTPAAPSAQVVASGYGVTGDSVSGRLVEAANTCLVLSARGSNSVEDLDLSVFDDGAVVLARDEAPDASPNLVVCSETGQDLFFAARLAAGYGQVAVGVQVHPYAARAELEKRWLSPREDGAAADTWGRLDDIVATHLAALGGRWRTERRMALRVDSSLPSRFNIEVPRGRCRDVLLVPSPDVGSLDVSVADLHSRLLGRAERAGRNRQLLLCGEQSDESVSVEVRPSQGRGLVAVVLSASEGTRDALGNGLSVLSSGTLGGLDEELRRSANEAAAEGFSAKPRWSRASQLQALGQLRLPLTLQAGCERLDIVAEPGVRALRSSLFSAEGQLIAEQETSTHSRLWYCTAGGPAHLEVTSLSRAGKVQVEARGGLVIDGLQKVDSLGLSRLLSDWLSSGLLSGPRSLGAVSVRQLAPDAVAEWNVAVPAGTCVHLSATAAGASAPLEFSLTDRDGQSIDRIAANRVARVRTCGPLQGPGLVVSARLRRMASEEGAVLVSTQTVPTTP
jgi:hypothetical protein